jgi:hypothetical protein
MGIFGDALKFVGGAANFIPGVGPIIGTGLNAVGGFLDKNPGLPFAGASAISNANRQASADRIRDEGLDIVRQDRARRMGTQDELMQGIRGIQFQRPDVSHIFADPSNPFARSGALPPGGAAENLTAQQVATLRSGETAPNFLTGTAGGDAIKRLLERQQITPGQASRATDRRL